MNAFTTAAQILGEPSSTHDVLRIIAGEASLSVCDRQSLCDAADELESAQRTLAVVYANLIETQQRLRAASEKLIAERDRRVPLWSYGTGPMKVQ